MAAPPNAAAAWFSSLRSGCVGGSPFCSAPGPGPRRAVSVRGTGRWGRSEGTYMQGWGGVGGDPGPDSPSSLVAAEVGGAVPGWAGPWRTFFLPWTLRRAPGTALGLRAGWQDHPSPLGSYSQLQGAPLPTRAPPSLDQHLVSRKGRSPGRERGGVGGAESGELGSGGEPTGLHPIILRSWSSGLLGGAPAEQRACAGEGSP